MYEISKSRKCTEWPQTELEHLRVKSTLYTLNTYPWGPNFAPFLSTISRFRDTTCMRSAKVGNAPNDSKLNLNTEVKSALYTLNTYPWGPNFALCRSTISRFRDTTCTRSVKIGNEPNDPKLNFNTQQSEVLYIHMYTKYLPLRPKFCYVSLYD